MFKEEAVLNVWQSESNVLINLVHTVRQRMFADRRCRQKWNVRQGTNGNMDLGLIVQFRGVISDRNGRPQI